MNYRQRGALESLRIVPLPAQPGPIDPESEEQRRRHRDRHERELPVDARGHVDHSANGERSREERNHTRHRDILNRLRVVLDPICGVGRAAPVVVGERELLSVPEQPAAQVQKQPLTCRRGQPQLAEALQLL